ncbi:hypothetical protein [Ruegeria halocynthiae]|uniref:hypothetical protein n=1 Tax=Ruegeria halocynthiae TaxID=985054 RepID=UPI000563BDAB|nr:hypothetical protein [Ruegeria halocynthiae]
MKSFTILLRAEDNSAQTIAEFFVPSEEWDRALRFVQEANALRNTAFVQKEMGGSINLTVSRNHGISSKAREVDPEAVGNMLMKLRPFVLQKDQDVSFYAMAKVLKRYADHAFLRKQIDDAKSIFDLKRMQGARIFTPLGLPPVDNRSVMDWLNAFHYHRELKKREAVMESLGIFGKDKNGQPVVLFAIVEMIEAIQHLSDLIETLALHADGTKPVTVPPEWFEIDDTSKDQAAS